MTPQERIHQALANGRADWLTVVDVLHDHDDPDLLRVVHERLRQGRYHLAQATEDRWIASMEFERIHHPWRPAAALEADFDHPISRRRLGAIAQQPPGWWLVAVLPLLMPLPGATAVAIAAPSGDAGVASTPWQLGRNGLRFSLLPPGHRVPYVLYDMAELHAFVELTFTPFFDLAPGALDGEDYPDPVLEQLAALPDDEIERLDELHTGSRIGGWRVFNAEHLLDDTTCERCKQPLWYAAHLGADLLSDTFGEAGSLHLFACPNGCGVRAMIDGA